MPNHHHNLQRALAILATHPDETDISVCSIRVSVAGQRLCPQDEDDREVLSILMAMVAMIPSTFGLMMPLNATIRIWMGSITTWIQILMAMV